MDEFSSLDYDPRSGFGSVTVDARLSAVVDHKGLIVRQRGKPPEMHLDFVLTPRKGRWL